MTKNVQVTSLADPNQMPDGKPQPQRILEIDGIRGWAAIFVLLFHFFATCLGHRIPFLQGTWLRPAMDGPRTWFFTAGWNI